MRNAKYEMNMRCFLALPLNDELRDAISHALIDADKPRNLRRVDERLWHVTMVFLGEVEAGAIKDIVAACKRYYRRPGSITFGEFKTFPARKPRMLVAAGSAHPYALWSQCVNRVRKDLAPYAPNMDLKPWRPHMTLARSEKGIVLPAWRLRVGPWTWMPGGFTLYHSELSEHGPEHRVIHEFPFTH
jgi:2'-5' RNA ligase